MKREQPIFYYVLSGIWDTRDRAEVKLPDEQFGEAGSAHYNAAVLAMNWIERQRWVRLMQTIERIEEYRRDASRAQEVAGT